MAPQVPGIELGELLARGGTSEVWAGAELASGRGVAVKVVDAGLRAVEAAAREAAVSARAASAHVVEVSACVETEDGRVALVMPHLRGGALDGLVGARGRLTPGEVVTVLTPVASALGRLHELGVVHGDVSPGNVLLDLEGRPHLADLGLAHVVGDVAPGVWGTDGFVAPEVVLGADPTASADVYGLGALGWLCLTGEAPGPPGLRAPLTRLVEAGPGSVPLVEALEGALAPEPGDRPGAHLLAWQLFRAADPAPLELVRGGDEVSAVTFRLRAAATGPAHEDEPPRRHRMLGRRRGHGPRGPRPVPASAAGWAATALASLAFLVVLVLSVATLGRAEGEGEGAGAAEVRMPGPRPAATAAAADGSATPARRDPRTDPHAPRERPAALLQELASHRAAAWRDATPALLHGADAPRSAAAERDTAGVIELARAGLRYTGLRYSVRDVATVSAAGARAVLRARIDTGAHAVTGPSGSTPRAAGVGEPLLVDVLFTEDGWRISDVRALP